MTLSLGGNIELDGFNELDGGQLIVVKKIVGTYAKQMSESMSDFEKLSVSLEHGDSQKKLNAILSAGGNQLTSQVFHANLFYALDQALAGIIKQLK